VNGAKQLAPDALPDNHGNHSLSLDNNGKKRNKTYYISSVSLATEAHKRYCAPKNTPLLTETEAPLVVSLMSRRGTACTAHDASTYSTAPHNHTHQIK